MDEVAISIPDGSERILLAGLESYGPFYRLPESGGVNRFAFWAVEKHADGAKSVAHGVLLGFTEGAMTAVAGVIVSLSCDFGGEAEVGECIEAHVKVVRTTRSLVFLTAELTADGRIIQTANGLARV